MTIYFIRDEMLGYAMFEEKKKHKGCGKEKHWFDAEVFGIRCTFWYLRLVALQIMKIRY